LNKAIKEEKLTLIDKTKEAIENLTDQEVEQFLHMKWIDPMLEGINGTLTVVLSELEKQITTLARKYATSYSDLTEQLATAQTELSALVADLTGDEFALKGLQELNK
jgi:type I restriction enzyme M protein